MDTSSTLERIRSALEGTPFETRSSADGMTALGVACEHLRGTLEKLYHGAGFSTITMVTGVDRYPAEPRFELHHQLLSPDHADRVRITTCLPEDAPNAPTCIDLWPGAAFMERECFDMFGIVFDDHPNLRRLLMPEEYGHYPLRKDFPHAGIEPDRLYREWDRERRKNWDPVTGTERKAASGENQ